MKKDDAVYLHHILAAVGRIETYSKGITFQEFLETGIIQDAVVRQLEIIGEASRNLSSDLCRSHTEVSWGEIIGLRNRVAHAYFDIDIGVVWEVVQEDIPHLKEQVLQILGEIKEQERG